VTLWLRSFVVMSVACSLASSLALWLCVALRGVGEQQAGRPLSLLSLVLAWRDSLLRTFEKCSQNRVGQHVKMCSGMQADFRMSHVGEAERP